MRVVAFLLAPTCLGQHEYMGIMLGAKWESSAPHNSVRITDHQLLESLMRLACACMLSSAVTHIFPQGGGSS